MSRGTRVVAWIYLCLAILMLVFQTYHALFAFPEPSYMSHPHPSLADVIIIGSALVWAVLYLSLLLSQRWAWWGLMVTYAIVLSFMLFLGQGLIYLFVVLCFVPCLALGHDWRWGMGRPLPGGLYRRPLPADLGRYHSEDDRRDPDK